MAACTFFGHSQCYRLEKEILMDAIEELIQKGMDTFYVGNHGDFDVMVHNCLKRLSMQYPHIRYRVVLAYLPLGKSEFGECLDTIFPEGMEVGPPQFAIERRNRWMVNMSDCCLCYIDHTWGGAYKFARLARRRGLSVINLGNVKI